MTATPHQQLIEDFDRIRIASGGRIDATVHTTGEIVPYYTEYQGVQEGILDVGNLPGYEFMPIQGPKCNLIGGSGFPGSPTPAQFLAHFYTGNGQALANELWGDWGVVIGASPTTPEIFAHSNIKLERAEDFDGIKFRTAGVWGDILSEYYGTSVVQLPGGEIYQAAERGIIDCFEYCPPDTNWPQGFHEITKYLIVPGIHSPGALNFYFINNDSWNELPPDLQELVRSIIKAGALECLYETNYLDALAMQKYRDYGTEIVVLSDEFQQQIVESSKLYHQGFYDEDPMFKKIWDDLESFISIYKQADELSSDFSVFD